nr:MULTISPECIES: ATP-binding cassette domain-containing protein [Caldanaerobacter]
MVEALKKAGLLDWFKELPEGFDTKIGQTRKLISGGERSRLSIARMILFDPEILLLDEPLVGVDQERKEEIFDTLKELLKSKTCILVTHDKSLLRIADRTIYMKEEDAVWLI